MARGKGWAAWNVGLWIANDEGLYSLARECIRRTRTRAEAAAAFVESLAECGVTETPDGARYSVSAVRRGMAGL